MPTSFKISFCFSLDSTPLLIAAIPQLKKLDDAIKREEKRDENELKKLKMKSKYWIAFSSIEQIESRFVKKLYDYFAFENGVITFNESINCNNLKIIDDCLCEYIDVEFYANDFLIGDNLIKRKLTDKNWYLEKMNSEDLIKELTKRCETIGGYAFPYNEQLAVVFDRNGDTEAVAEINLIRENGELKPTTTIFGKQLIASPSIYGVEYIDVWLLSAGKTVCFTLKYKT